MAQESDEKIRVLVVDDIPESREKLRKALHSEPDIEVVGATASGEASIEMANELTPDIILMDIDMPDLDGIAAVQAIAQASPGSLLITMSVQEEAHHLRRSMLTEAHEFLTKPFSTDELVTTIRRVHKSKPRPQAPPLIKRAPPLEAISRRPRRKRGEIIALYGPKGGIGCSTITVNLAIAMAKEEDTKVAVVDCDLQFGDVGVLLNIQPHSSIADLVPEIDKLSDLLLGEVMQPHSSGVKALLAPPRPEMADLIEPEHLRKVFPRLQELYDYIIVDTPSPLSDLTLAILEVSDRTLLVITPDMPTIKKAKLSLETLKALEYPMERVALVLNKVDRRDTIQEEEITATIKHPIFARITNDRGSTLAASNEGVPLIIGQRNKPISRDILALARQLKLGIEPRQATEFLKAEAARRAATPVEGSPLFLPLAAALTLLILFGLLAIAYLLPFTGR